MDGQRDKFIHSDSVAGQRDKFIHSETQRDKFIYSMWPDSVTNSFTQTLYVDENGVRVSGSEGNLWGTESCSGNVSVGV